MSLTFLDDEEEIIQPAENESSVEMPEGWIGRPLARPIETYDGGQDYLQLKSLNDKGRRGFMEELMDPEVVDIPWLGSLPAIGNAVGLANVARKLNAGEDVSDDDLIKFNTFLEFQNRKAGMTIPGKIVSVIQGSITFGAEIGLATLGGAVIGNVPGAVAGGGAVLVKEGAEEAAKKGILFTAKKLAQSAATRLASKGILKGAVTSLGKKLPAVTIPESISKLSESLGIKVANQKIMREALLSRIDNDTARILEGVIGKKAATRAAKIAKVGADFEINALTNQLLNPQRTVRAIAERRLNDAIQNGDESVTESVIKGFLDMNFEYGSEFMGKYIGKLASRVLPKKAIEKLAMYGLIEHSVYKAGSANAQKVLGYMKTVGIDGMLEEMGEERIGGMLRGLFGVEGNAGLASALKGIFPSGEDAVVEAFSFLAMPLGVHAVDRITGGASYQEMAANMMTLHPETAAMTPAQYKEWATQLNQKIDEQSAPWWKGSIFESVLNKTLGEYKRGSIQSMLARRGAANLMAIRKAALDADPEHPEKAIDAMAEYVREYSGIQTRGIQTQEDVDKFNAGIKDGYIVRSYIGTSPFIASKKALTSEELRDFVKQTGIKAKLSFADIDLARFNQLDPVQQSRNWHDLSDAERRELIVSSGTQDPGYAKERYDLLQKIMLDPSMKETKFFDAIPVILEDTADNFAAARYIIPKNAPITRVVDGKKMHAMYLGARTSPDGLTIDIATTASMADIVEDVSESMFKRAKLMNMFPAANSWMDSIRDELLKKTSRTDAENDVLKMLADQDKRFEFVSKTYTLNHLGRSEGIKENSYNEKFTQYDMPDEVASALDAAVGDNLVAVLSKTPVQKKVEFKKGKKQQQVEDVLAGKTEGGVEKARQLMQEALREGGKTRVIQLADALAEDWRKGENKKRVLTILKAMEDAKESFSLDEIMGPGYSLAKEADKERRMQLAWKAYSERPFKPTKPEDALGEWIRLAINVPEKELPVEPKAWQSEKEPRIVNPYSQRNIDLAETRDPETGSSIPREYDPYFSVYPQLESAESVPLGEKGDNKRFKKPFRYHPSRIGESKQKRFKTFTTSAKPLTPGTLQIPFDIAEESIAADQAYSEAEQFGEDAPGMVRESPELRADRAAAVGDGMEKFLAEDARQTQFWQEGRLDPNKSIRDQLQTLTVVGGRSMLVAAKEIADRMPGDKKAKFFDYAEIPSLEDVPANITDPGERMAYAINQGVRNGNLRYTMKAMLAVMETGRPEKTVEDSSQAVLDRIRTGVKRVYQKYTGKPTEEGRNAFKSMLGMIRDSLGVVGPDARRGDVLTWIGVIDYSKNGAETRLGDPVQALQHAAQFGRFPTGKVYRNADGSWDHDEVLAQIEKTPGRTDFQMPDGRINSMRAATLMFDSNELMAIMALPAGEQNAAVRAYAGKVKDFIIANNGWRLGLVGYDQFKMNPSGREAVVIPEWQPIFNRIMDLALVDKQMKLEPQTAHFDVDLAGVASRLRELEEERRKAVAYEYDPEAFKEQELAPGRTVSEIDADIMRLMRKGVFSDTMIRTRQKAAEVAEALVPAQAPAVEAKPAPASTPVQTTGFKGYRGGFENTGKGTSAGDGKDKAMREVADGIIVELKKNRQNDSSTATSLKRFVKDYLGGKEIEDDGSWSNPYFGKWFDSRIVMLARNSEFSGRPLHEETKSAIEAAAKQGSGFVVGDMPGVDSQFVDLLESIGANFEIYHTGNTPRIKAKTASAQSSFSLQSAKHLPGRMVEAVRRFENGRYYTEPEYRELIKKARKAIKGDRVQRRFFGRNMLPEDAEAFKAFVERPPKPGDAQQSFALENIAVEDLIPRSMQLAQDLEERLKKRFQIPEMPDQFSDSWWSDGLGEMTDEYRKNQDGSWSRRQRSQDFDWNSWSNIDVSHVKNRWIEKYEEENSTPIDFTVIAQVVEEWKTANNIVYDPQEAYAVGEGFFHDIGAFNSEGQNLFSGLAKTLLTQARNLRAGKTRWWEDPQNQVIVSGYTAGSTKTGEKKPLSEISEFSIAVGNDPNVEFKKIDGKWYKPIPAPWGGDYLGDPVNESSVKWAYDTFNQAIKSVRPRPGSLRLVIRPHSQDIIWAAVGDVYSGTVRTKETLQQALSSFEHMGAKYWTNESPPSDIPGEESGPPFMSDRTGQPEAISEKDYLDAWKDLNLAWKQELYVDPKAPQADKLSLLAHSISAAIAGRRSNHYNELGIRLRLGNFYIEESTEEDVPESQIGEFDDGTEAKYQRLTYFPAELRRLNDHLKTAFKRVHGSLDAVAPYEQKEIKRASGVRETFSLQNIEDQDSYALTAIDDMFDNVIFRSGAPQLHRVLIEQTRAMRLKHYEAAALADKWLKSVGLLDPDKGLPEEHAKMATSMLEAVGAMLDGSTVIPDTVKWERQDNGKFAWTVEGRRPREEMQKWDDYIAEKKLNMPSAQAMIDQIKPEYEKSRQEANKMLQGLTDAEWIAYVENYINHEYRTRSPEERQEIVRMVNEESARAKERKFPTYYDAAKTKGLRPRTMNAVDLYKSWNKSVWSAARNKSIVSFASVIRDVDGAPIMIPVRAGDKPDYTLIDDTMLRHHLKYLADYLGEKYDTTVDPMIEIRRLVGKIDTNKHDYVMLPSPLTKSVDYFLVRKGDAEKIMKTVLHYGESNNRIVRAIERLNLWSKFMMLSFSMFHPFAQAESLVASFGVSLKNPAFHPKETYGKLKDIAKDMHVNTERMRPWILAGMGAETRNPDVNLGIIEQDLQRGIDALDGKDTYVAKTMIPALKALKWYKHKVDKWLWHEFNPAMRLMVAEHIYNEVKNRPGAENIAMDDQQLREDIVRYVNDSIGGQEWEQYIWATPLAKQVLHLLMFAPDWTISSANIAGLTNIPIMGQKFHISNLSELAKDQMLRKYWPAMTTIVLFGIPSAVQLAIYGAFGNPDDGDEPFPMMNEVGKRTHIDITPIMRMFPGYGGDTGKQRSYMRWGKQAWEVLNWIQDPAQTWLGKSSSMFRTAFEQATGTSTGGFELPFKDKGLLGIITADGSYAKGRLGSIAEKFVPMSITAWTKDRPLAFIAPMSKGASFGATMYKIQNTLEGLVDRNVLPKDLQGADIKVLVSDIIEAGRKNGVDVESAYKMGRGKVLGKYYTKFFRAINEGKQAEAEDIARVLLQLGAGIDDIDNSMEARMGIREYDAGYKQSVKDALNRAKEES